MPSRQALAVLFFGEGSEAADGFGDGLVGGTRDGCPSAGGKAPGGAERVPAEPGEAETETVLELRVIARQRPPRLDAPGPVIEVPVADPQDVTPKVPAAKGKVPRRPPGAGGHDRRSRVTPTPLGHEFVTSR